MSFGKHWINKINVTTSELTLKDTELNHQNSLFFGGIANNIPFDL